MKRAQFIRMGTVNGLSRKETMLSCPGVIFDLWELYLKANGVKKGGEVIVI